MSNSFLTTRLYNIEGFVTVPRNGRLTTLAASRRMVKIEHPLVLTPESKYFGA
jgi:hypothetical protein